MTDRVLVADEISEAGVAVMRDGGLEVDVRTDLGRTELLGAIDGYEAIIVRSATQVDGEVIEAGQRLKVIGRAGVGVDNVDVTAATRRGIVVVNAPQGNIISNAEHTIGLLLALVRRIPQAHAKLVAGTWDRSAFMGTELNDKVLGLVGLGNVGTLVAQKCHAFGMRVIARDPYIAPERFARLGIERVEDLGELLARSDVLSIHVPKTAETSGMLSDAELERCKDGVYIVNTARGGIIDEDALARAIKAGKVAGAALDAFASEPLTSSPLFELDQVVVTPHLGGSTHEAQDKAGTSIAEQVLLALQGEFVPNAVNLEAGSELPEFVRPFVGLSNKLGRLAAALAGDAVGELEVAYQGQISDEDTRVLTLSALRGYLQGAVHEPVTYVNAPVLAADRGIDYGERKSKSTEDYLNLLRVTAKRDDRTITVAGTLSGPSDEPLLVEIDGVAIGIELTPYMAFLRYTDRPGVVYRLSGVLANHDINIAGMKVGRRGEGEEAIMAVTVDSSVPPDVLEEMIAAADITSGRFVVLDSD